MSTNQIIRKAMKKAYENNINFTVKDGQINYRAPQGLPDDIRSVIQDNKADFIELLEAESLLTTPAANKIVNDGVFQPTQQQVELFLLQEHKPELPVYNIPKVFCIDAQLIAKQLNQALQILINNHEILRTQFLVDNGIVKCKIHQDIHVQFNYTISKSSESTAQYIQQAVHTPFNLQKTALIRLTAIEYKASTYLVFVIHHSIADEYTCIELLKKYTEYYNALSVERDCPTRARPDSASMMDYACWQNNWLNSVEAEMERHYWASRLDAVESVIELTPKLESSQEIYKGGWQRFTLPADISKKIEEFVRINNVSEYSVLLTAYSILLHAYFNSDDIIVGSAFSTRDIELFSRSWGYLINPVLFIQKMDYEGDIVDLIKETQHQSLELQNHKKLPFGDAIASQSNSRGLSLKNFMFDYVVYQTEAQLNFGDYLAKPVDFLFNWAKNPLTLSIKKNQSVHVALFEWQQRFFDSERIYQFEKHYIHILKQVLDKKPLKDIDFLLEREHRIISEYNDTVTHQTKASSLIQCFTAQVNRDPQRRALTYKNERVSYKDLSDRSNVLSAHLQSHYNIKSGDVVAICMDRCIEMFYAILAVLRLGAAYLPIDPDYPEDRQRYMLEDSDAKLMLIHSQSAKAPSMKIDCLDVESYISCHANKTTSPQVHKAVHDSTAYIIYTSGSTGKPKGVHVRHCNVLNYVSWFSKSFAVSPMSCFDFSSSLAFDLSVTCTLLPLLSVSEVIITDNDTKKDARLYLKHLADNHINYIKLTPSYFNQLINFASTVKLDRLQYIVLGGETLPATAVEKWLKLFPMHKLVNEYGPTETTVAVSAYMIDKDNLHTRVNGSFPIGYPALNTKIYIVNQHLKPCPLGGLGELYISGNSVSAGYINSPKINKTKFLSDPWEPLATMYCSGDLATWSDQQGLLYLGRLDNQVKVRGYRIELGEIASVISQIPGVIDAVVINKEVDSNNQLVAYFQGEDQLSEISVRNLLQKRLPEFMLPHYLVKISEIPLTTNGKIDTSCLPNPKKLSKKISGDNTGYDSTAAKLLVIFNDVLKLDELEVDDDIFTLGADSISCLQMLAKAYDAGMTFSVKDIFELKTVRKLALKVQNQREDNVSKTQVLLDIWKHTLNVDHVSIDDDFFALGGDSITALQVLAKAYDAGISFAIKDLFMAKSIRALLPKLTIDDQSTLVQDKASPCLLPIQHWFFSLKLTNFNHWNQAIEIEMSGAISFDRLQRAMNELYRRHEAFHLCFKQSTHGWTIHSKTAEGRDIVCLISCETSPSQDDINTTLLKVQDSFDIEQGRLFCAVYFDCNVHKEHRLFLVAHHLCVDAVSWRILLDDLNQIYHNNCQLDRAEQESYYLSRWSAYLNSQAYLDEAKKEISYWKTQLSQQCGSINVDNNHENIEGNADEIIWKLDLSDSKRLLMIAAKLSVNPKDLLMLSLLRALEDREKASTWLINCEHHGRNMSHKDFNLSRTVGWLTSLYPVLLSIDHLESIVMQLKHTRQSLESVPNNGMNYNVLRHYSDKLISQPQICFNYLGKFSSNSEMDDKLFAIKSTVVGNERAAINVRPHLLDINSLFYDEKLHVHWIYPSTILKKKYMTQLIRAFSYHLQFILDELEDYEGTIKVPSDYKGVTVSQETIDHLRAQFGHELIMAPATPTQQGFIFHHLRHGKSGDYLTQLSWNMTGKLDVAKYQSAWRLVYQKFAMLRTGFVLKGVEVPLQVAQETFSLPLTELDWCELDNKEQRDALSALLKRDRQKGFNIEKPCLSRIYIIKESTESFRTLWTYDHTILDGWSLSVVLADLFRFYEHKDTEFTVDTGFFDYAKWLSSSQNIHAATCFWSEYFSQDLKVSSQFPSTVDCNDQHLEASENALYQSLGEDITGKLIEYVKSHGVTLNTLMQGVWALLLSYYSDNQDIILGVTVSGRNLHFPGIQNTVGMFINTLPLKVSINKEQAAVQWLKEIQDTMRKISEFEHFSITEIGELIDKHLASIIQTNIVFENYPVEDKILANHNGTETVGELRVSAPQPTIQTGYPVSLIIIPGHNLGIKIAYNNRKHSLVFIRQLQDSIYQILTRLTAQACITVGDITQLLHSKLSVKNHKIVPTQHSHKQKLIFEQLEVLSSHYPEKTALSDNQGNVISYAQMHRKILQLSSHLRSLGIGRNDIVGLCCRRSIEAVIAMFAINKAGGAYLPIDHTLPQERISFMINDANLNLVVCHEDFSEKFEQMRAQVILPSVVDDWGYQVSDALETVNKTNDLMYVIYTSGSTGKPKAVLVEHKSVIHYVNWASRFFDNNDGEGVLLHSSLNFDISVTAIFPPLLNLHPLYVIDEASGIEGLIESVKRAPENKYSLIKLTPTHLTILREAIHQDLSKYFRVIVVGGEVLLKQHLEGIDQASCWIINHYGPTEATCGCCANMCIDLSTVDEESSTVPIGRPITNMETYILDDHLQLVRQGDIGELYIAGPGVARGYLNCREQTEKNFPTSQLNGKRLYRTGDLVKQLADGQLIYIGRADHQVKFNGYRIELEEIEKTLLLNDDVRKAAVIFNPGVYDSDSLVAYVEFGEFQSSELEIRAYLQEMLPEYMIPSEIIIVDEVPLTKSGKIDRKSLVNVKSASDDVIAIKPPVSETEKVVHSIWESVFNGKEISIDHNFFEIGGHSLKAVQIISKTINRFDCEVPLQLLFEYPNIYEFSKAIDALLTLQANRSMSTQQEGIEL